MYFGAPGHRAKQALVHRIASSQGDHGQPDRKIQFDIDLYPIDTQVNMANKHQIEGKTQVRVLFLKNYHPSPIAGATSHNNKNKSEGQCQ